MGDTGEAGRGPVPVATLTLTVEDIELEEQLYDYSIKHQEAVRHEITAAISSNPQFSFVLLNFKIERGSIHFLMEIGQQLQSLHTNGYWNILWDLSKYKSLCDSIALVGTQVASVIGRALKKGVPAAKPSIVVNWRIHTALLQMQNYGAQGGHSKLVMGVVGYLALSHAALLGFLIWLLVTHFK